jgi:hypothetical protein
MLSLNLNKDAKIYNNILNCLAVIIKKSNNYVLENTYSYLVADLL